MRQRELPPAEEAAKQPEAAPAPLPVEEVAKQPDAEPAPVEEAAKQPETVAGAQQVTCNLCNDPACRRLPGQLHRLCIHYKR